MDDNRFDDIIKGKLGEYEDPGFDPSALASLHHRMASTVYLAWYSRYRTELAVGAAIIIISLLTFGSQWYWNREYNSGLLKEIESLKNQNAAFEDLKNDLHALKSVQPDTVRIIEYREQGVSASVEKLTQLLAQNDNKTSKKGSFSSPEYFFLGRNDEIPEEIINLLIERGLLKQSGDELYLTASTENIAAIPPRNTSYAYNPKRYIFLSSQNDKEGTEQEIEVIQVPMSAETIRKLNKHHHKGVGIRVGPTAELLFGNYDIGNGEVTPTGGISADFLLAPNWSVETGFTYSRRSYTINDSDDINILNLPVVNFENGTLEDVEVDSDIIEIPLNLKYRYSVSNRTSLVTGIGVSGYIYTNQNIEYTFDDLNNSGLSTVSERSFSETSFYTGAFRASLGIDNILRNNNNFETSIFYQTGLGSKGAEDNNANFFGLRATYWFNVR